MGSFGDHAIPGSMFIILSLWLSFLMTASYHDKKRKHQRFVSSVSYKSCNAPIEGILKTVVPVVGVIAEAFAPGSFGQTVFFSTTRFQHISLYSLYILSGIVDILFHFRVPFPKNTDYAMFSLALLLESFLYTNHAHGKDVIDALAHMIVAYIAAASGLILLLEAEMRGNILICLGRPFCFLVKGMWFWQMGYVLFPNPFIDSPWQNTHMRQMQVGSVFVWLCIAFSISVLSIFVCMGRYQGRTSGNGNDITKETNTLLLGEDGF